MSATWTDKETFKLIEILSDECIWGMLEGCRRNKDIIRKTVNVEASQEERPCTAVTVTTINGYRDFN